MTTPDEPATLGRLLTVGQAADILGTTERFPRRLIEERRIAFVKLGRHVRIPEAVVRDYIATHTVVPATRHRRLGVAA
jgi:excisionase family DNA binding protein